MGRRRFGPSLFSTLILPRCGRGRLTPFSSSSGILLLFFSPSLRRESPGRHQAVLSVGKTTSVAPLFFFFLPRNSAAFFRRTSFRSEQQRYAVRVPPTVEYRRRERFSARPAEKRFSPATRHLSRQERIFLLGHGGLSVFSPHFAK